MNGLSLFKHLLPRARAWSLTKSKQLREFFEGLSGLPEDIRSFFDDIYGDLDPQTTRALEEWEFQFGLPNTGLSEQERRDRLTAAWAATGGQSPGYIQETLQAAGFNVFVHEWWEPIFGRPAGGSINNDVSPVARDPFEFLWDGSSPRQTIGVGHNQGIVGGDVMFLKSSEAPPGYPLVNKIITQAGPPLGVGHAQFITGGASALLGATVDSFLLKQYAIPADPTKYPFFLYIGNETFPEQASIPLNRKNEFEDLCLKICPTEQWLGILVDFSV